MRPTVADSIDAQHGGSSIESTLPNGSEDPRDFSDGDAGDVESVWLAHDTEAERTVWLAHDTEAERTLNGEFGEEYFVNCQPSVTAIHDDGHNEIEETDILGGIDANTDVRVLQGLTLRRPADWSHALPSLINSSRRSTPAANSNRIISTPQHTSSLPVLGGVAFAAVAGIVIVLFYLYSFRS
ncbi:hypothetical protein LTR28_011075 [Elasticomyces elasticus]|nr:hypothetical protein LTR28_011075 [Elasticomyces elasticus]